MYNNDSDSLDTGAPDITITGNQNPNTQMASYGYDEAMAESRQAYDDARKKGIIPFDMEFDEFLELMQDSKRAPQQNSGIMASAPGTYSQRRKQMMAGGGIAGLKQIGKPGGLVEPGISKYGILDFITDPIKSVYDKVVDDIIPNEIKDNPLATAALIGGGINQFGIPGTDDMGKNWLGNLLGGKDAVLGPGGSGDKLIDLGNLFGTGSNVVSKELERVVGGYPNPDLDPTSLPEELSPFRKALATILPGGDPGYVEGGLYNKILGGGDGSALSPYLGEEGSRRVNPLYPLGIGAAVGKYVEGLPKDELPMDKTSIDPAAIAAAARGTDAQGIAAGLRFLPEQVTRAAQGGRIGFDAGGSYEAKIKELMDMGMSRAMAESLVMSQGPTVYDVLDVDKKAQGGRIGYAGGGSTHDEYMNEMSMKAYGKPYHELTNGEQIKLEEALNEMTYAQGGRIGYAMGKGVESIPTDQMQSIQGQQAGGEYNRAMELMLKVRENIPLTDEEKEELRGLMQTLLLAEGGRVPAQEGGLMANMDMIALEFMQEFGYDMMLANPDVRENFIQKWKEKNFYDKSEAPGRDRVMAQEGGLMDLGGMEKDYREEGGFVPIGGQEKADDVPARLSKNEFVFTADAVRNAGGGDIDRGAEVMENMMNYLEAGGEVSEDSQGLEGARGMFANAQKLQNRII